MRGESVDSKKMSTSQYLVFSTYTNSSAQTMPLDDRLVDSEEGLTKTDKRTERTPVQDPSKFTPSFDALIE